jgi:hypothetical protein
LPGRLSERKQEKPDDESRRPENDGINGDAGSIRFTGFSVVFRSALQAGNVIQKFRAEHTSPPGKTDRVSFVIKAFWANCKFGHLFILHFGYVHP